MRVETVLSGWASFAPGARSGYLVSMPLGAVAYGLIAGLSLGIGFLFTVMGLRRGRLLSTELCLGILAFGGAGQTLATLALHSAQTSADYEAILHGPFTYFAVVSLAAIAWTVGVKTGVWSPRVPLALTGMGLIAVAVDELSSGALIVDDVTGLREVHLLGETFVVHEPGTSSLQWMVVALLLATTAYIGLALLVRWRRAKQTVDPLLVGIAIFWIISLYDVLVDNGLVDTTYLAPFAIVVLVGGLAIEYGGAVIATERRLIRQSATLETVVTSRTAALHAAHDDLVTQLHLQNTSALRLAKLSEMFLTLSSVSSADDDLDDVLAEAVGRLAELLDASDAVLTWRLAGLEDGAVTSVDWVAPNGAATMHDGQCERIDRTLQGGGHAFGRLTIRRKGADSFSAEHHRLVDLTADFLGSVLLRLELESTHVSSAVDHERHRIARELHDSLSQRLYAAAFNADAITQSASADPDFAIMGAAKIRVLVLSTLAEIRTLLYELQPEVLSDLSLDDLVAQLCTSVAEIYQQPIELTVAHGGSSIPTEPKLALYRIVQESLGNALRHSHAANICVAVDVDSDRASVDVVDDGIGFDSDEVRTGHGLRNIGERAAEAGIGLNVVSVPGVGTTISASWPRERSDIVDLTVTPSLEVAG